MFKDIPKEKIVLEMNTTNKNDEEVIFRLIDLENGVLKVIDNKDTDLPYSILAREMISMLLTFIEIEIGKEGIRNFVFAFMSCLEGIEKRKNKSH